MRCHREYQADTSALITKLRRLSKRRRFTGGTEQDSRIRAAATAVRAIVLLERIAQRLNSSELRLSLGQAQLTRFRGRIVRVISFALRSSMRFPMNAVSIEREEIGFFLQDLSRNRWTST